MRREKFVKLVGEALDTLPARFRKRVQNVAVLVEDVPPVELLRRGSGNAEIIRSDDAEKLVLGVFEGCRQLRRACLTYLLVPSRLCFTGRISKPSAPTEDEIREEIRLTVLHELCHYFGMTEAQLEES